MAKKEYYPHGKSSLLKAGLPVLAAHCLGVFLADIICVTYNEFRVGRGLILFVPLALLIYAFPVYSVLWGLGREDKNLSDFGHIVLDRWHGMKVTLVGLSPFILMGVLFFFGKFGLFCFAPGLDRTLIASFKVLNGEIWPLMNAVGVKGQFSQNTVGQAAAIGLMPLIPVVIGHFGYYFGIRDISLAERLIYKKKDQKKQNDPDLR